MVAGVTFKVFNYDAVYAENQTHHLPNSTHNTTVAGLQIKGLGQNFKYNYLPFLLT